MLSNSQKLTITAFARECVSKNDPFHDFSHISLVASTAIELAELEDADPDICWTAAMLHDICKSEQGEHAALGSEKAADFLLRIGCSVDFVTKVKDAIFFHNKDFTESHIERQVMWDSDKLYIMTPAGFEKRMLAYWILKLGEEKGIEKAIFEYGFYYSRFHTASGKLLVERNKEKVEKIIEKLKNTKSKP